MLLFRCMCIASHTRYTRERGARAVPAKTAVCNYVKPCINKVALLYFTQIYDIYEIIYFQVKN